MSHNDCKGKSGYQDSSPAMSTRKHAFEWSVLIRFGGWSLGILQSVRQLAQYNLWKCTTRGTPIVHCGCVYRMHWLSKSFTFFDRPNNCSTRIQSFAWLINVWRSYSLSGYNVIISSSHEKQPQFDIRRLDLVDSRDIWRGLNQLGSSFPRNWPSVRGTTGDRWIPLTKACDAEL